MISSLPILIAGGLVLACLVILAVVVHVAMRRLTGQLQDSVQAALERQHANQQKLADAMRRLDGENEELQRRVQALERSQGIVPVTGDSQAVPGNDDRGDDGGTGGDPVS